MVVGVAMRVHHSRAVPEGRAPTAPVLVSAIGVEYEPAALHLRIAECRAATAGHLIRCEREVHVLGRVTVEIEHLKGAVTRGEAAGGIGVAATLGPTAAVATRTLEAAGGADLRLIGRAITPALVERVCRVMSAAHPFNTCFWRHALCQVKAIVGRCCASLAGILPLMSIAQALAFRRADLSCLRRFDPYDRIAARDIRK